MLRVCVLAVGLLGVAPCWAQGLDKAFEALRVFNYFEAKRVFEKNAPRYPAGAHWGLATIRARRDNPFYQLDTALTHWRQCEAAWRTSAAKDLDLYRSLGLTDSARQQLRDTLAAQLWLRASMQNTLAAYGGFVAAFDSATQRPEAERRLHSLAYAQARDSAQRSGSEAPLIDFAQRYPTAPQAAEARAAADGRFFARETAPGTPEAYLSFAQRLPKHPLATAALDSVYVLSTRAHTPAAYRQFIRRFPQHPRLAEAWRRLYESATADARPERYLLYLAEFATAPNRSQALADLRLSYARLYPIKQDSLWGFADSTWVIAVSPEYDSVQAYSEGRAAVERGGRWGYIDRRGQRVVPLQFDEAEPFQSGVAVVGLNDRFGLIDGQGRWLLLPEFDAIGRFNEGLAPARKRSRDGADTLVFVNVRGEQVIPPRFANAGNFSEGLAWVRLPKPRDLNGDARPDTLPGADSVGFVSPTGERVIAARYTWADDFAQGVARVRVGDRFGLIDAAGNYILLPEFRYIGRPHEGRLRVARDQPGGPVFGYYDLLGQPLGAQNYAFTEALASDDGAFARGHALVQQRALVAGRSVLTQGLIDSTGALVVAPRYESIRPFSQGRAAVAVLTPKGRKWGYLARSGQPVVPPQFDAAWDFRQGRARVRIAQSFGYVDSTGRLSIPATFTWAEDFDGPLGTYARVQRDTRWGLIDRAGQLILPPDFDAIEPLGDGLLRVIRRGKLGYFDLPALTYRWSEPYFFE